MCPDFLDRLPQVSQTSFMDGPLAFSISGETRLTQGHPGYETEQ